MPASSCGTIISSSLRMFISRMSRAGDRRRNCSRAMKRGGLAAKVAVPTSYYVACSGFALVPNIARGFAEVRASQLANGFMGVSADPFQPHDEAVLLINKTFDLG